MLKKEYKKEDLTVIWKPELCYHSKNCVKNLPEVFRANDKPWIQPEHASTADLKATIDKCPSGALSYAENSMHSKKNDKPMTELEALKNGPIVISGEFTIKVDGKEIETGGKAAICRCGQSQKKPLCDGSHVAAEFKAD